MFISIDCGANHQGKIKLISSSSWNSSVYTQQNIQGCISNFFLFKDYCYKQSYAVFHCLLTIMVLLLIITSLVAKLCVILICAQTILLKWHFQGISQSKQPCNNNQRGFYTWNCRNEPKWRDVLQVSGNSLRQTPCTILKIQSA